MMVCGIDGKVSQGGSLRQRLCGEEAMPGHVPGGSIEDPHSEKKRKRRLIIVIAVLLLLLALCALVLWSLIGPSSVTGSKIHFQGSMTAEEVQALIDEEVEKSRITVSLLPDPVYSADTGMLDINFIVDPENNGFSERFDLEQDDVVLYESGVVPPGNMVGQVPVTGVHAGTADITVYAVDEHGRDHGSPVSVEVDIKDAAEGDGRL